jgi:hypothetical protein
MFVCTWGVFSLEAVIFIHTSNALLHGLSPCRGMVTGKALCATGEPHQAVSSLGLRLPELNPLGRESYPTAGLLLLGRERSSGKERHMPESPLMLASEEDVGERTLLCPQRVPFLYGLLLQGIPLLRRLVLC